MSSSGKTGDGKSSGKEKNGQTKPDKKRELGFSEMELHNLLDIMKTVLPICTEEWQTIERKHAALWPEKNRTKESPKRKFQQV